MNGTGERLISNRRYGSCWRTRSRGRRREESTNKQVAPASAVAAIVEGHVISNTHLITQRLTGDDEQHHHNYSKQQEEALFSIMKTSVNTLKKSEATSGIFYQVIKPDSSVDKEMEDSTMKTRLRKRYLKRDSSKAASSLQKHLALIHLAGLFLLVLATSGIGGLGENSAGRSSALPTSIRSLDSQAKQQLQLLRSANVELARRSNRLQRDTSPAPETGTGSGAAAPTCGYPGSPAHASVTFNTSHVVAGTAASYTCDNGYELLGPPRRICQANGTWSPVGIPFCVLNVGLGKAAMQSSTAGHGSAQKAVDGSTSPYFQASTCTMTDVEHNPWWYVNLLEPYLVQIVRIDFGTACCANRQKATIAVRVGNNRPDLGNNPLCNRYNGFIEEGKPLFLPCTRPAPGAFVSIHLESPSGSALSICETFIYTDHALSIEQCPSFRDQPLGSTATYNGKCYLFHNNQALNFDGAQKYCESRGGTLVDETSPALQGFLSWELYRRHRNDQLMGQYWLGAVRDARNSQNWKWISGKDVQISFWSSLTAPTGNCSRFDGSKGWLWSDTDCSTNLNFICQYRPLSCGKPEKPTNSTLLTKNIDNGTVIEYQCAPGNLLMGPKSRACLPTGFFSEFAPKCKYLDCQFPAMIPNGNYKLLNGTTSYQSVVNYFCQDGFQLYGKAALTCDVDERWNGPPPRCEPLLCPAPVPPSNGYVTVTSNITVPGTQATYDCRPGYELVGDHLLTCSQSGSWDNSFPYCREKRAILPPHVLHAPASTTAPSLATSSRRPPGGVQFPQTGRSTTAVPQTTPTSTSPTTSTSPLSSSSSTTSTTTSTTSTTTSLPVSLNGLSSQFGAAQNSQAPLPAPPPPPSPTTQVSPGEPAGDAQTRKVSQSAPSSAVFDVAQSSPQPAAPAPSSIQQPTRTRPTTAAASPTQTFTLHSSSAGSGRQQPHLASASNKFPQISAQQPSQQVTSSQEPSSSSSTGGNPFLSSSSTTTTSASTSTTAASTTSQVPHLQHSSSRDHLTGAGTGAHNVLASFSPPGRSAHSSLASAKYSLDGIIAVAIFGGFIFLGAIITIIVIIIRRKSSHSSSIDAQTISTYDSNSGEHNGLYRNYQQAWENLRFATPNGGPPKSSGGGGVGMDGGMLGASAVGLKNFAGSGGAMMHPHSNHHQHHHHLAHQAHLHKHGAGGHHNLAMVGTGSTTSSQSSSLGGGGDPLLRNARHAHQQQRVIPQQQHRLSMQIADSEELDADEHGVLSADETSYHEHREPGEGFRDTNELTINADTVFNNRSTGTNQQQVVAGASGRRLYSNNNSIGRRSNQRLSTGNLSAAVEGHAHLRHAHHHAASSSGGSSSGQHRRLVSSSTPSTSTHSSRASPPPSDEHSLEQLAYGNSWHQHHHHHQVPGNGSGHHHQATSGAAAADSSSNNSASGSGASILGGAGRANQLRYN